MLFIKAHFNKSPCPSALIYGALNSRVLISCNKGSFGFGFEGDLGLIG